MTTTEPGRQAEMAAFMPGNEETSSSDEGPRQKEALQQGATSGTPFYKTNADFSAVAVGMVQHAETAAPATIAAPATTATPASGAASRVCSSRVCAARISRVWHWLGVIIYL
ncbi:hypothetical protein FRC10_005001 [Ceratobasidium sp. 414]|nr:hypothetical protein FRC10_005001 [Ceratobasidium sp. 414]